MAKKKQTDNEIIDELVAAATPEVSSVVETVEEAQVVEEVVVKEPKVAPATKKAVSKVPGMYHNGRLIEAVPARIGNKWTVIIDGKREKVLKAEIEIVE